MNYDSYGEVTNGSETYHGIAEELSVHPVMVGWTDQNGTHLDILFSWTALAYGTFQGGITPRKDLFVSIMRVGAFGFEVNDTETDPGYYAEKLTRGQFLGSAAEPLADLINGVRKELFTNFMA